MANSSNDNQQAGLTTDTIKVLVADSDRLVLATLCQELRESGFALSEASSFESLKEVALANKPDLAILDYEMPGIAIPDLLGEIGTLTDIPILFLSARIDEETVRTAVELGAMAFLTKPVDPSRLAPVIRIAISRFKEMRQLREEKDRLTFAVNANRAVSLVTGVLMERLRVSERVAFERLRQHARQNRRRLVDVANELLGATDRLNTLFSQLPEAKPPP